MDLAKIKAKLATLENSNSRKDVIWKPKAGSSTIRIVPYLHDRDMPFRELYFYYSLIKKTLISPMTFGKPDPIVELCQKLKSTGEKEDYKLSKKLEPKMRTFVPILVRGEEDQGVKFFGFGQKVYTEILKTINDPDYGDITDPMNGRDVVIEFTPAPNAQSFPETTIRVKPNITPVTTDKKVLEMLKDMPKVDELWECPTYEELAGYLENFINNVETEESISEDNDVLESQVAENVTDNIGDAFDAIFKN